MIGRFSKEYGAGPLHLLAALASFVIAGYAVVKIHDLGTAGNFAVWFLGAIVAHDLVLLPLYSLAQSVAFRLARVHANGPPPARAVLLINHVRVPAMISVLMFALFFPSIVERNDGYVGASGLQSDVYLERWLLMTAGLFVLSGLLYAIRRGRFTAAATPG